MRTGRRAETPQPVNFPRGLLKIIAVTIEGPDGEYETTALLDEGSTATLIDSEVATRIGAVPIRQERVRLEGVGDMSKVVDALQKAYLARASTMHAPSVSLTSRLDDWRMAGPGSTTSLLQLLESDLAWAEKTLLRHSQWDCFAEEITHLRASQPLPKASRIASLCAFLDKDNLLRADTRIKLALTATEDVKAPIILDGRSHIVRLLIMELHVKMGHGFDETVLNELRQRYRIINARKTIKSVSSSCAGCRRFKGRPVLPPTGDLPLERLNHHTRPFTFTGLDYFGPFAVAVGRRQEKRYVALFTCLVTRAIHLEVVTTLSADAAITSLRRFIARRGSPKQILSDNGTNFVGASKEMRKLHGGPVIDFATNGRIRWRFIPPAAPFMGGAWERLVRTVKNALKTTLKNRSLPKEDTFRTLLLEAEAIVNSRPLTYVPTATDAPEAITPFHFLIGTSSVVPWTNDLTDGEFSQRQEWRKALRLADHFWARWLREYLPTLREKLKESQPYQDIKEGDVVLIVDPTLPRGLWPLARVSRTYPGQDGRVRVADLLTKGGTLRRPARKLIVLEAQPVATEF
ncbi:uncharacterized protein LOC121727140 [Aricia agestis]|uniref:uncharacterized protein LOC121727140 n=1 Tax=Aricia agestis TaxID=91739 RepID=UPI001C204580|nr:uncharacterized protein LOC121727140 [Aricia agestis]